VTTPNAKCEKCRELYKSVRIASETEDLLRSKPTARHKLDKAIAGADKGTRLKAIREWMMSERKSQPNQTPIADKTANRAARRLAITLTIDLGASKLTGVDATPVGTARNETIQQSAAICQPGACPTNDGDEDEETTQATCQTCGHLQHGKTPQTRYTCPCCSDTLRSDEVEERPCTTCRWVWLLQHNSHHSTADHEGERNLATEKRSGDGSPEEGGGKTTRRNTTSISHQRGSHKPAARGG
jgi:hypothetical protein